LAAHPEIATQLEECICGIEFIHEAESPLAWSRPVGDFRILREIGRGGMGAVYEAEQLSLGRRVALKVLRFGSVSDPAALERFRREAETIANLHHTNIVPIFSVGQDRGVNYYAMQLIDGRSLDLVAKESSGPLDPNDIAAWGLQAAEALTHAHQRGVIHRDVKPSNLILRQLRKKQSITAPISTAWEQHFTNCRQASPCLPPTRPRK
jgi:serine/threonine protein kinase